MKHVKAIHIRRLSQLFFLLVFLILFLLARDPLRTAVPTELLLRLDPFAALIIMISDRILSFVFWPALVILTLTFILGRSFCGWVCPLGTCLDIWNRIVPASRTHRGDRRWKYALLMGFLALAFISLQTGWLMDPLVIFTRTLTLSLYPLSVWGIGGLVNAGFDLAITEGIAFWLWNHLQGWFLSLSPLQTSLLMFTLLIFLAILLLEQWGRRFWCRVLCPLGAFLGVIAHFSPFGRKVDSECTACAVCRDDCRMNAIEDGFFRTRRAECILCLECSTVCPIKGTTYTWYLQEGGQQTFNPGRRRTLGVIGASLVFGGVYRTQLRQRTDDAYLIRPPGAVTEDRFLDLCLRCEECVKACSSTGRCLQPADFRYGIAGFWTPRAKMREGYCEYSCTLCGDVCPSGAIKPLTEAVKQKTVIGLARINRARCIPWVTGEDCIVCEEHCPTPKKAIQFRSGDVVLLNETKTNVKLPYVDATLCIGCGICEYKCPVVGESAILVTRENEQRQA